MASRDDERAIFEWSFKLMTEAFRDLAGCFAEIDPDLADEAIEEIEKLVVRQLTTFQEEHAERIGSDAINATLKLVVPPFREMTQSARAMIQQKGQSKH